jgi:hypothetical protein
VVRRVVRNVQLHAPHVPQRADIRGCHSCSLRSLSPLCTALLHPRACHTLQPQNILGMLHAGTRDLGFAGADWVAELVSDATRVVVDGTAAT